MFRIQAKAMPIAAILSLALIGCAESPTDAEDPTTADQDSVSPVATASDESAAPAVQTEATVFTQDTEALFAWLNAGEYKSFPVKDELHQSVGPHDFVVVYYNEIVAQSLADGNDQHPPGSVIIKEQFKDGEETAYGWSVSIKTHQEGGAGGEGWYWIEFLDREDITNVFPAAPGNGVADCSGCHTIGKDFVRSAFPK